MSRKKENCNLLKSIIFFTNLQKVLSHFLYFPSRSFYDREVSQLAGISKAGTNFSLRALAEAGLLNRERKGRMYFYALARRHPLNWQLKVVYTVSQIMPLVKELEPHTERIVLYGSAASGKDQEESDIDLLVLTRNRSVAEEKIRSSSLRNRVHVVIHSPHEWATLSESNAVFAELVGRGIVLWEAHES